MNAPSKKKIPCPHCDRKYAKAQGLADHLRDSHGVAPELTLPQGRRPTLTEITPLCIECGKIAYIVAGDVIFPHRPDLYSKRFYLCDCGAYCGCHPNSIVPLGFPCGPATRAARQRAHAAFDPLWKSKELHRRAAYKWLAEATGIEPDKCHIGMMTEEQAELVCCVVAERREQRRSEAA